MRIMKSKATDPTYHVIQDVKRDGKRSTEIIENLGHASDISEIEDTPENRNRIFYKQMLVEGYDEESRLYVSARLKEQRNTCSIRHSMINTLLQMQKDLSKKLLSLMMVKSQKKLPMS